MYDITIGTKRTHSHTPTTKLKSPQKSLLASVSINQSGPLNPAHASHVPQCFSPGLCFTGYDLKPIWGACKCNHLVTDFMPQRDPGSLVKRNRHRLCKLLMTSI